MKIKEFGVETWINTYEKDCTYNLTNTCVGILSTETLVNLTQNPDMCWQDLKKITLDYGNVFGSKRLLSNISDLYEKANMENVAITHGAVGANALVMLSLINPDDEIITYLPIYEQHYSIPASIGAKVTKLYLKEENQWLPNLEELKEIITPKTKLICLNNPNNPTGAVIDENYLSEIVKIARKNDTYILCDEVYRGLTHNENNFTKSIFDLYEKGISTSSMSKTFSLPGLRLGWIVANENVIEKIKIQRTYHVISVGKINDYLACLALENKEKIVKNNLEICLENLEILDKWVNCEENVSYVKPNGGTTAFLKYNINMNSIEFCQKLQYETGLMLLPGDVMEMEKHLRLGYTGDKENLEKSLEIFSKWLKKF